MSPRAVPLADLCEMDRRNVRPGDPLAADLPFVGVETVTRDTGFLNFDANSRIGNGKSTAFRFDERHVLYSKLRPYLNKVAAPDFAGRCSTQLVPLLPRDGVDRDFLAHVLRRGETVKFAVASANGSRMPSVDMKLFMAMPIPFPPFDTQRRIAGMLNRAARIVRLREKTNERIRDFAPTLFAKMFGDPIESPMGWKIVSMEDLCTSVQYGTSKKSFSRGDGMPVLRMCNVTYDGDIDCSDLKYAEFTEGEYEKYALLDGDIIFNRTNSRELVGKTGLWDGRFDAVAASYFIRLRVDETAVRPVYVWAYMNSISTKQRLFDMARGAIGQWNINAKEIRSLLLPVPPLHMQRIFESKIKRARTVSTLAKNAGKIASTLSASLVPRLLERTS